MQVFQSLLNHPFAVERRERLADGQGGFVIVYQALGTVQGRLRPLNASERVVADAEKRQITHVLYTLAGASVARGDRVSHGETVVEVLGVREPSLAGEHWEIDCREWQYEVNQEWGS